MKDLSMQDEGPCPYKQGECLTCWGGRASGPIICNMRNMQQIRDICGRFYIMAELHDKAPNLWEADGVCCEEWRYLALRCMEHSGFLAGAFDIGIRPNDGKWVWRNFVRVRFKFCPFCGQEARPSPDDFNRMWGELKASVRQGGM